MEQDTEALGTEVASQSLDETPRRPGRPKRAEVTQQERRRRKTGGTAEKLAIPQSVKDRHPGMHFYWCADDQGKVQRLTTEDDWDVVPGVNDIHAGPGSEGKPIKHILLMKPEEFMTEDRREKLARLREVEDGTRANPDKATALQTGASIYQAPD